MLRSCWVISLGASNPRVCMASFIDSENQSSFGRPHLFIWKILGIFEPHSNKTCRRGSSRLARRICPSSFSFCCLHVSDYFSILTPYLTAWSLTDWFVCDRSMNVGGILRILRMHFIWKASILFCSPWVNWIVSSPYISLDLIMELKTLSFHDMLVSALSQKSF